MWRIVTLAASSVSVFFFGGQYFDIDAINIFKDVSINEIHKISPEIIRIRGTIDIYITQLENLLRTLNYLNCWSDFNEMLPLKVQFDTISAELYKYKAYLTQDQLGQIQEVTLDFNTRLKQFWKDEVPNNYVFYGFLVPVTFIAMGAITLYPYFFSA